MEEVSYYDRSAEGEHTGEAEYHREEIASCLDETRFAYRRAVFSSPLYYFYPR